MAIFADALGDHYDVRAHATKGEVGSRGCGGRRPWMSAESASDDLKQAVELHHRAGDAIMKGSHEGYAELYSRRDDITLGNPFGPFARGYENVLQTLQGAASHYRDGEATGFERVSEHVTPELACFVEVEIPGQGRGKR
jgi:hypothetical protein